MISRIRHRLLHRDREILVRWDGPLPLPEIRDGVEMKDVLASASCSPSGPQYYMYRDLSRAPTDHRWMETAGLRYDITVIPPGELCGEFVKTMGHYHPDSPDGHGYPEIYEVLAGRAHYLLQTRDLSSVVLISAEEGDIVIIPPGFGHVTVNPSPEITLQMANIVSSRFTSEYSLYGQRRGAAYYELTDGAIVRNPAYPHIPELQTFRAKEIFMKNSQIRSPLYRLIEKRSPVLQLLNNPGRYCSLFRTPG